MAKHEHKILEEGKHDLYISNAEVWRAKDLCLTPDLAIEVARYGSDAATSGIKISLSPSPRGKPRAWLYLFNGFARLWAVQLAEYCLSAGLPWPSFNLYEDVIATLTVLKRRRVPLRIKVAHKTMDKERSYVDSRLLRLGS